MNNLKYSKLKKLNRFTKNRAVSYSKKRWVYQELIKELNTKQIIGLSGLRGVGKTILLSQIANQIPTSFYISCDTLETSSLYELITNISLHNNYTHFFLDEIHYYKNWEKDLKQIFDFSNLKIFFSSSVSLDILESKHDLTRRVKIINIPSFSFGEYLDFKHNISTPKLAFNQIINHSAQIFSQVFELESYFLEYLSQPLPYMLEDSQLETVQRISRKIIEKDIFYSGDLTSTDIIDLKQTLRFIASTPLAEANYTVLSKNIGITKYKAKQYIDFLQRGYLVSSLLPYSRNVNQEPKVLISLPFRKAFMSGAISQQMIGALREEFFVQAVKNHVENIFYLKSKTGSKTPDYLIENNDQKFVFEVGGKNKGFIQFKGLKNYTQKYIANFPGKTDVNQIPLLLFGFLN